MNELKKDRVETRLEEMGKSKSWLAQEMGMQLQSFSRMLGGNNQPRLDNIIELSKILNVSIDYLLGISEVSSIDVEIKSITEKTGLSEESVNRLIQFNNEKQNKKLRALNQLLEKEYILNTFDDYFSSYPCGESFHVGYEEIMSDYIKDKAYTLTLMEELDDLKATSKYRDVYRDEKISHLERRIYSENLSEEQIEEISKLIKKLKNEKNGIYNPLGLEFEL